MGEVRLKIMSVFCYTWMSINIAEIDAPASGVEAEKCVCVLASFRVVLIAVTSVESGQRGRHEYEVDPSMRCGLHRPRL